jgi:hypothetical protein
MITLSVRSPKEQLHFLCFSIIKSAFLCSYRLLSLFFSKTLLPSARFSLIFATLSRVKRHFLLQWRERENLLNPQATFLFLQLLAI